MSQIVERIPHVKYTRLNEFLGSKAKTLIDGCNTEPERIEIVFPTAADELEAVRKLVRVAMPNRLDALKFLLETLDEYEKES